MQNFVFKQISLLGLFLIAPLFAADDESSFLKEITTIVDPNEAQWAIRHHINDDENKCLELFKDAMQQGNSVAQLYCANAYYAMQWDKPTIAAQGALGTSDMHAYHFVLDAEHGSTFSTRLNDMYRIVKPQMVKKKVLKKRKKVMMQAAATGNAFAQLALIDAQRCRENPLHFGHACKLRELRKADGTFPFDEAIEMYRLAIQNAQKHMWHYKTMLIGSIPIAWFNLFEKHNMQEVSNLIRSNYIKLDQNNTESFIRISRWRLGSTEIRRSHATNTVSVTYDTENQQYSTQPFAPLALFIKDAWSRCSDDDIKGIIDDIKKCPEAFGASKDGW